MKKQAAQNKEIAIARRRATLAELVCQGVRNREELAERLGVARTTVYDDLRALQEEFRERSGDLIAQERFISLMRLESYVAALQPDLKNPGKRIAAVRMLNELEQRRARLLGLDSPYKYAPTSPDGRQEYTGGGIPQAFKERLLARAKAEESEQVIEVEAEVISDD